MELPCLYLGYSVIKSHEEERRRRSIFQAGGLYIQSVFTFPHL